MIANPARAGLTSRRRLAPHRPALQYCGARSQPTAPPDQPSARRPGKHHIFKLEAVGLLIIGALILIFTLRPLLASHRLECPLTVPFEPLLVVILGPTGSGKTALSLALAERFSGEIVNCDSVAMYREFEIGTAKPTPAERARVPHHLLDFVDPSGYITAGEYARQARQILQEIKARGALPIVVGGTGLYLRALLEGLFAGPQRSEELRERLRDRAEEKGRSYLHQILSRLDPAAAAKIHANDTSQAAAGD